MELETFHLTTLLLTALVILYADHQGYSYMRGTTTLLNPRRTQILHRAVWTGLILMIGSGALLFWNARDYYLVDPVFLLKMGVVVALVINGIVIGKVAPLAVKFPFAQLSPHLRGVLLISGAVSLGGWLTAATIGMFFL